MNEHEVRYLKRSLHHGALDPATLDGSILSAQKTKHYLDTGER